MLKIKIFFRRFAFLNFTLFYLSSLFCQAPSGFKYQAVLRDKYGQVITDEDIQFRLSLLQGSEFGAVAYSETQITHSSQFGLINLIVGDGNAISGSFGSIDWSAGQFFLKVELKRENEAAYSELGTAPIQPVPVAMFAERAKYVDDADADPYNEIQDLQLTGNILTITKGNSSTQIDLSIFLDNTDNQNITFNENNNTLEIENGNSVDLSTLKDNTKQNLSLNGAELSISDGNSVDLSPLKDGTGTDDQTVQYNPVTHVLTLEDGGEVDLSHLDSDKQQLNLENDILSIENGNTVSLEKYVDNTDAQQISFDGTNLSISGGNIVDLAELKDRPQLSFDPATNILSLDNGGSVDLSTLIPSETGPDYQTLSFDDETNVLTLENGGSIDLDRINLTDIDNQWIALFNNELRIENGNSIDLSPYIDNTDEQELSLEGNILSISNGNSVDLSEITGEQNTDEQALSYDPQTNELSLENGGTVDLTDLIEDEDADPQNEIQVLSKNGNTLSLSKGGGTVTIDASNYAAGTGVTINNNTISARNSNPLWNANQLQGHNIDNTAPSAGDLLFYDGSKWVPQHGGTMIPTGGCISTRDISPPAGFTYSGHSFITSGIDEWSYLTDMIGVASRGMATAVVNGKFYVFGGDKSTSPYYQDVVREYDPASDSWTIKSPMPNGYTAQSAAVVNGKIYVTGGRVNSPAEALTLNYEYDPTVDTWATKAPMKTGRMFHNSVAYNGKIFVMGGAVDWYDLNDPTFTNTNEMYDPVADTWTYKANVPGDLKFKFGLEVINDKIYLIGGTNYKFNNSGGDFFNTNYVYDPITDSWSSASPLPEYIAGNSAVINNEIYCYGFNHEPGNVNMRFFFFKYTVWNDQWSQIINPNTDRRFMGLIGHNDMVYCIAGEDGVIRFSDVEVFSPQNAIYYLHCAD